LIIMTEIGSEKIITHRRRRSGAGFYGLTQYECAFELPEDDPFYEDCRRAGFFSGGESKLLFL